MILSPPSLCPINIAYATENSIEIPPQIKHRPDDPAVPLLGIYPKKSKTLILKDPCTSMFIAALFMIAKIWKQPKYSWKNK